MRERIGWGRAQQLGCVAIVSGLTLVGLEGRAIAVEIQGGTLAAPVDITSHVIAGDDITFNGGYFLVVIPRAGAPGTTSVHSLAANGDTQYPISDYGAGHFVDDNAPAIIYRKTIKGTGTLSVANATNATTNPSTDPRTGSHPFTGGVLLFTNLETFWSGSLEPSLRILPNTTVAFDQGQPADPGGAYGSDGNVSRNIVNDGYLYQFIKSSSYSNIYYADITNTIPGAGVVTWENGGVATNGHKYTGHSLNSAGAHIEPNADFEFDNVINLNDFTFETYGPSFLLGDPTNVPASIYAGNIYNPGIDVQIQSNRNQGIRVLTGLVLTPVANTKKDFVPELDSLKMSYFRHSKGDFGLSVYVQATLQLGNGQAIVDHGDGLTNVAIQGNANSTFIQTGNFESAPTSAAEANRLQTLGLDYSGTYHFDACMNTFGDGSTTLHVSMAPGNFVVMNADPGSEGKAPNHVILTCPMLAQGVVRVEPNAVLQLGDGTPGRLFKNTTTFSDGTSFTDDYSDSSGNGMVLTKLNSRWPATHPEWSQIIDDGTIIVDNVPDALDIATTWSDPGVVSLLLMNQLDTISGSGGIEQRGALPLTLAGESTYTGGTLVAASSTLLVAGASALGARTSSGTDGSGAVINHGVLAAAGGNHVIHVPGDYDQSAN